MPKNRPESSEDLHFLLVEDDEDLVFMFTRAMARTRTPGRFHVVHDGQEAIDYLSGQGTFKDRSVYPLPCLIVSNVHMPRRNGIELLEWLRSQDKLRQIPVIVVSSSKDPLMLHQAKELGARAFWTKPDDLRALERVARKVGVYLRMFCKHVKNALNN